VVVGCCDCCHCCHCCNTIDAFLFHCIPP
jgi:hypothetical protein